MGALMWSLQDRMPALTSCRFCYYRFFKPFCGRLSSCSLFILWRSNREWNTDREHPQERGIPSSIPCSRFPAPKTGNFLETEMGSLKLLLNECLLLRSFAVYLCKCMAKHLLRSWRIDLQTISLSAAARCGEAYPFNNSLYRTDGTDVCRWLNSGCLWMKFNLTGCSFGHVCGIVFEQLWDFVDFDGAC